MSIEISAKKVIVRGEKRWEITKATALRDTELPSRYIGTFTGTKPCVIGMIDGGIKTALGWRIVEGFYFTSEQFAERIEYCRQAGERLKAIKAELAKENAGWEGEHTFII